MALINTNRLPKLDCLMLPLVIGLACYMAFIPHQNYLYPVHIDEWVHIAYANATLQAGSITFPDPFLAPETTSLTPNLEVGFHLFCGVFQQISGIDWMIIFRYFPSIIFAITVLSVYIMARRYGFGIEAAFFTCLIPTTVGILGPAFLVPVSLGLLFTPLLLFLALNFKSIWAYLLIFLITCFLLSLHAPSAICPVIILAPYILLNARDNFKHSLGVTTSLILPFLIIFPWIADLLLPTAQSLLTPQPLPDYIQFPRVIQTLGYIPILFCLLGTLLLAVKGGKRNYSLILGMLALTLVQAIFFTFHYGVPIIYERGLLYMMLMITIVAGAGLAAVKHLSLPERLGNRLRIPRPARNVGIILYAVIIVVTLAIGIPARQDTPYYHMIDNHDYQSFVWIRDNIGEDYGQAILDPWKATAFTAITGQKVYARIHAYPTTRDEEAYAFLMEGSTSSAFLRENDISVVYTRVYDNWRNQNIEYAADNPDLIEIADNIYLLRGTTTGE